MKTTNGYALLIGSDLYSRTPKAVFAALAVSFANRLAGIGVDDASEDGEFLGSPDAEAEAQRWIVEEWKALKEAGIVPQSAPGREA